MSIASAAQLDCLATQVPSYRAGTASGARPQSDTSVAAGKRVDKTLHTRRAQVLIAVIIAGSHGITCRELATQWGVGMNTVSGRFTELRDRGHGGRFIRDSGKRRDGCVCWVRV